MKNEAEFRRKDWENTVFTVVTRRSGSWIKSFEAGKLGTRLGVPSGTFGNMDHPLHIILEGEHTLESIKKILGRDEFGVKTVKGIDNPELPFRPTVSKYTEKVKRRA